MRVRKRGYRIFGYSFALLALFFAVPSLADPCLVVYPNTYCVYHYDPMEYYTVGPGDPLYDPLYDRGGKVLLDVHTNAVDPSIYQAPFLMGFQPSTGGEEGYFFAGTEFDLIVDGFNNAPVTYTNILLVFVPYPSSCTPTITVGGNPVLYDTGLGLYYPIGDLVVSTPTPDGNNYSDTVMKDIHWSGCSSVRIWAFADEDHDLMHEAGECFTAFSHDVTVPTERTTWGAVKAMFSD